MSDPTIMKISTLGRLEPALSKAEERGSPGQHQEPL